MPEAIKSVSRSLLAVFMMMQGCSEFEPKAPADSDILDGPLEGLSPAENKRFQLGDVAFNDDIFTTGNGLGPIFVATSCGSCHPGDGKGHPFTTLTRFGQSAPGTNSFLHLGGPQLQNRAIPGFSPEAIPHGATSTRLTPPANTGLGYLDAVSDEDIYSLSDPNDDNHDGISGVPNWIFLKPYVTERTNGFSVYGRYMGRFGKKASTYDLLQQTATAYNQDIGVMTSYEPFDPFTGAEADPEVSNETVENVVFYLKTLKAPVTRNVAPDSKGGQTFMKIQCGACHVPQLKTGPSNIEALSNKIFRPYTDLLLHDMGPGLDDGYTEGSALTSEWRTPPLWGLGLSKDSQGGTYYLLHDGRARSIDEAIRMHGGEASLSRDSYLQLSEQEKAELIEFLEGL